MVLKIFRDKNQLVPIVFHNEKSSFFYICNKKNNIKYVFKLPSSSFYKIINKQEILFVFPNKLFKKISIFKVRVFLSNLTRNIFQKSSFSKKFVLKGLGFKYELIGNRFIKVNLSYSHSFYFFIPHNLTINSINSQVIVVSSKHRVLLDQFSQLFIKIKNPTIFKNKGIFIYNLSQNL